MPKLFLSNDATMGFVLLGVIAKRMRTISALSMTFNGL